MQYKYSKDSLDFYRMLYFILNILDFFTCMIPPSLFSYVLSFSSQIITSYYGLTHIDIRIMMAFYNSGEALKVLWYLVNLSQRFYILYKKKNRLGFVLMRVSKHKYFQRRQYFKSSNLFDQKLILFVLLLSLFQSRKNKGVNSTPSTICTRLIKYPEIR